MKKKLPFIFLLILIVAGILTWCLVLKPKEDTGITRISGNIEVTDLDLGFKISGRLEQCLVNEGDTVSKSTVLARLEDEDQKILVRLARADLERAQSILQELEAGARPQEIALSRAKVKQARQMLLELTRGSRAQEIESARAELAAALSARKSAATQLGQAKADFNRFSTLYREKSASQRDLEVYQTRYEVAQNSVEQAASRVNLARQALSLRKEGPRAEQIEKARAVLAQAEAQYALIKAGPRQEKIDQARIQVNAAEEKLNQARQQLSYTVLTAPMDGVILTRSAEPGEFLNPATPVVTLGDLAHPWLRAYVSEKNLGKIRLNEKVNVTTDSFPDKSYEGTICFISSQAEFTPKSVQTFEERVKLMFRIKISLANPNFELKPGMPADAVIHMP